MASDLVHLVDSEVHPGRNIFNKWREETLTLFAAATDLYNIDIQIVSRVRKTNNVSDVSRHDM